MYQMSTLELPFMNVYEAKKVKLNLIKENYPSGIEIIIEEMLSKEKESRPNAREVHQGKIISVFNMLLEMVSFIAKRI